MKQILFYSLIFALSLAVFSIFKPYHYIDNKTSVIVCDDNKRFEIGWNFIYTFSNKLDSFNDIKARKLCAYNVLRDYNNTVKTPEQINYRFEPKYIQESSWFDAFFMAVAVFLVGLKIANLLLNFKFNENLKFKISNLLTIIIGGLIGIMIFTFFLKQPSKQVYCHHQVARKVNNFKRVIFRYNIYPIPEEDKQINSILKPLYQKCLLTSIT